jgi:uncharacterized membrane protein
LAEPNEPERESSDDLPEERPPATNEPVVVDPTSQEVLGTVSQWYAEFHAGPLPSARELDGYNRVSPGLADTIVSEWRLETAHRRRLEQYTLNSHVRSLRRGQVFGLVISLFVVASGVGLTLAGRSTAGLVGIIAPLATLAGVFVYSEIRKNRSAS